MVAIWLSRFLARFLLRLVVDIQRISRICANLPFITLHRFLFAKLRLLLATKSAFSNKIQTFLLAARYLLLGFLRRSRVIRRALVCRRLLIGIFWRLQSNLNILLNLIRDLLRYLLFQITFNDVLELVVELFLNGTSLILLCFLSLFL